MDFVFICLNILRSMIREEVDYQIDLSFERNRLSAWLIKLAFLSLLPASIKTVYRVQNCRRLSIDLFEKIVFKTLLLPNSNIQDYVTLLHDVYTQLVF